MNQELKQRLMGAIVVTALAAIFIPMLFDDPIDKGGQSVTELQIPTPPSTLDTTSSKLPNSAKQVLETPDSESESMINAHEETELSSETLPPSEVSPEDEALAESSAQESTQTPTQKSLAHENNIALDTGVVDEQNRVITPKNTHKVIKPNPVEQVPVVTSEAPIKEIPKKPTPPTPKTVVKSPAPIPADNTEALVSNPVKVKTELSRWTLQAGSFSKKENAVALLETLKKQGLPATLDTVNGPNNSPFYRLRVGPTLDKKRALEMKAKLDDQKIQSLLISE